MIASEPPQTKWEIVADNLNTHLSESAVRLVAEHGGIRQNLGEKGKRSILQSKASRKVFLRDKSHRITFHFTPKHASWLNQIEIWFSILARKILRRGNFASTEDLKAKIEAFIDYFNETMAKPFKWTYQGKPLAARMCRNFRWHELKFSSSRFRRGRARLGHHRSRLRSLHVGLADHRWQRTTATDSALHFSFRPACSATDQLPHHSHQLRTGFLQSIPSV